MYISTFSELLLIVFLSTYSNVSLSLEHCKKTNTISAKLATYVILFLSYLGWNNSFDLTVKKKAEAFAL